MYRSIELPLIELRTKSVGDKSTTSISSTKSRMLAGTVAHHRPRDFDDRGAKAFDMLDIQRCVHIDGRLDEFTDIKVSLGVAASRNVAVREFINHDKIRVSPQNGVDVHFLDDVSSVFHFRAGNELDFPKQFLRALPPMRQPAQWRRRDGADVVTGLIKTVPTIHFQRIGTGAVVPERSVIVLEVWDTAGRSQVRLASEPRSFKVLSDRRAVVARPNTVGSSRGRLCLRTG
jgi:hypothetical protein